MTSRQIRLRSVAGPAIAVLIAVQSPPPPSPAPEETPRLSSDTPFLDLAADPRALPLLRRYVPKYLQLIEQQVVPPPAPDLTVRDFLKMPGLDVTPADIKALDADLAKLPE